MPLVEYQKLCDGVESCDGSDESMVCGSSQAAPQVYEPLVTSDGERKMAYCLPGLTNLEILAGRCVHVEFPYPDHDVFGVETDKTGVSQPNKSANCRF